MENEEVALRHCSAGNVVIAGVVGKIDEPVIGRRVVLRGESRETRPRMLRDEAMMIWGATWAVIELNLG